MKLRVSIGLCLTALVFTGCGAPPSTVDVVGNVIDPVRTVVVPTLTQPKVNLDAGFAATPGAITQTPNPVALTYQLGNTQRVAAVLVAEGTHVEAGQKLVILDSAALAANVAAAKADRKVTSAQVDVLAQAITDAASTARTLADNKAKVTDAIKTITKNLAQLKTAKPQLLKARGDLSAKLAQAEYQLAHYPPVQPPGVPSKDELRAAIAQLKAGISGINAKLAQIAKTLPKLTAGLAKARAGLAKLESAQGKLSNARAQLRDLHELAGIAAETADIPVAAAELQVGFATLTAPADGVVTWVAQPGEILSTAAPAAIVRESGPSRVTGWLSPAQLARVCVDDPAQIRGDWMPQGQSTAATLSWISPTADFPPSTTATEETHLTRAVQVEFRTDIELPAGVPVEISITGCHPAAGRTEQDR